MYSTDYFIRFAASAEYLQCDMERGFSFREYQLFDTREECEEHDFVEFYGVDPDTIAQNSDGRWGFALDGLCGFGPFESLEEAEEAASSKGAYGAYDWAGIYTGRYAGQADGADGDMFVPTSLVKTFCTEAIEA